MANTFVTLKEIARQALPRLIDNLVFPNLCHRDFSNDYRNMGDTVQVRKPVMLTANEFNPASGVVYEDIKESAVEVKLDKIATVDAKADAIETATSIDDLNRVFIEPAAAALAEKINSDGLALYKDIPSVVGTAGTTPADLAALAAVRKQLNVQKVPVSGRRAVWSPEADASFATIPAIVNAEKSGTTTALREGSIGRVFGLDNYMSQAIKTHVKGTLAASGSGAKITVSTAATDSPTVTLGSTTMTGTLVHGDVLTIAGKHYTVLEDATAASNSITVKVYPNITAASGAEATVLGNHVANLAFAPMAFAYVTRPLINPDGQGVASYVTSYNGISLRVTKGYDQHYKRSMYSMDVLYGYKAIYPELAVRVLG